MISAISDFLDSSSREGRTITVQLARAVDRKEWLAVGPLVRAEKALLALLRKVCSSFVSEWKVVPTTALGYADVLLLVAVVCLCTFAPELEGACLEAVVANGAGLSSDVHACETAGY